MNAIAISLDSAVVITERSKRTWWRRIEDGTVSRLASDARGRAMVAFADVAPLICMAVPPAELGLFVPADAGDAEAQAAIGQMFFVAGKPEPARYWLERAAEQGHADAMQWLAQLHIAGAGVPPDDNLGIMWLAKAAAHGHVIAQAQMRGLRPA